MLLYKITTGSAYNRSEIIFNLKLKDLLSINTDLCLSSNVNRHFLGMTLNGGEVKFQLGTCAAVTRIDESTYKRYCVPGEQLTPANSKQEFLDFFNVALV